MVECGSCERRFEVTEERLVRGQKFYPGERDASALHRFQRAPGTIIPSDPTKPVYSLPQQEKGYISPITKVSAGRIAIGWVGVLLIAGLVFLLSPGTGAKLSQEPLVTRLAVAVVGGFLGVSLIAYANPRTRRRTVPAAILGAVILLAVPFVFSQKPLPPVLNEQAAEPKNRPLVVDAREDDSEEGLRRQIGIGPLEDEIKRLSEGDAKLHAYGVWLRDLNDSNRLSVRDYILRASGADPASHIYPRDGRDYLMVLTGVDKSLEEIGGVVARLGRNLKVHPDLQVVEIQVDAQIFISGPLDKLTDKGSPAFYDLNKRELESIELDRVKKAVVRLGDAEPKIYREDITRHLIFLLGIDQVDFPNEICKALMVWAIDPVPAGEAALARLNRLRAAKKPVPREMVVLLAKARTAGALPIVEELWIDDTTAWESLLADFGPIAEPGVLARFPKLVGVQRHSAAMILGKVGTRKSLPVLEAARAGAEPEMSVLIDDAVKAINDRG